MTKELGDSSGRKGAAGIDLEYMRVRRHPAKMMGEHMCTWVHANTETLPAKKITNKIRKKKRAPSEKKYRNIHTVPMRTCVHVKCHGLDKSVLCAYAQRNHSLRLWFCCSDTQIRQYAKDGCEDFLFATVLVHIRHAETKIFHYGCTDTHTN